MSGPPRGRAGTITHGSELPARVSPSSDSQPRISHPEQTRRPNIRTVERTDNQSAEAHPTPHALHLRNPPPPREPSTTAKAQAEPGPTDPASQRTQHRTSRPGHTRASLTHRHPVPPRRHHLPPRPRRLPRPRPPHPAPPRPPPGHPRSRRPPHRPLRRTPLPPGWTPSPTHRPEPSAPGLCETGRKSVPGPAVVRANGQDAGRARWRGCGQRRAHGLSACGRVIQACGRTGHPPPSIRALGQAVRPCKRGERGSSDRDAARGWPGRGNDAHSGAAALGAGGMAQRLRPCG